MIITIPPFPRVTSEENTEASLIVLDILYCVFEARWVGWGGWVLGFEGFWKLLGFVMVGTGRLLTEGVCICSYLIWVLLGRFGCVGDGRLSLLLRVVEFMDGRSRALFFFLFPANLTPGVCGRLAPYRVGFCEYRTLIPLSHFPFSILGF